MGKHSVMICPGAAIGVLGSGLPCTLSHGLTMQIRASLSKVRDYTNPECTTLHCLPQKLLPALADLEHLVSVSTLAGGGAM